MQSDLTAAPQAPRSTDRPGGAQAAWAPKQAAEPIKFDHRVQFYEADRFLYVAITDFFRAGRDLGEPLAVFASAAHTEGLCQHLRAEGWDVEALRASGDLALHDANETLETFMVNGLPDRELFNARVGQVVGPLKARSTSGRIRVFGEMVDVLWKHGNAEGTVVLEHLWNDVGRDGSLLLLCSYFMAHFSQEAHHEAFRRVCATHEHVAPTEGQELPGEPLDRLRQIALLQQRALALEGEVEHRKRLEQALREALTDRKQLEDELRRQNGDLLRAVRFSEMFVEILGHDLRNPLSAISTAASLLLRRSDSEKLTKPTLRIVNSANRMGRMIDQLLDFTRIRLGKGIPIVPRRADLRQICGMARDEFEDVAEVQRLRMDIIGDAVGIWDADRLVQLVSNLISNALVHGDPAGTVVIQVDGTAPDSLTLQVRNAGSMRPETQQVLFEPFRSASNEKQEHSNGLGLGLFISQQIVAGHGGTIDVSSSDVEGTRLTVRLPRDLGANGAPPPTGAQS